MQQWKQNTNLKNTVSPKPRVTRASGNQSSSVFAVAVLADKTGKWEYWLDMITYILLVTVKRQGQINANP